MPVLDAGSYKNGFRHGRVLRKLHPGHMPGAGFTGLGAPAPEAPVPTVLGIPTTGQLFPLGFELVVGANTPAAAPPPSTEASYDDLVLAERPALYAKLSEEAGASAAVDAAGNGNHGTYQGGVTLGASGLLAGSADTAADFDGVNDRVVFGIGSNLQLQRFTLLALVRPVAGERLNILDYDATDSNAIQRGYHFRVDPDGRLVFFIGNGSATQQYVLTYSNASLAANQAAHVAARYDGTNQDVFVNGAAAGTQNRSANVSYQNALGLFAGFWGHGALPDQWGRGRMARLAVVPTALSDAVILSLANKALGV